MSHNETSLTPWPELRKPSQEAYAKQVQSIINHGGNALLEGPCGVGKSIGYLLPAASTPDQRTCIVTQQLDHLDQLRRDLEHYVPRGRWAILKGHSEYWCAPEEEWMPWAQLRAADLSADQITSIETWLSETKTGELTELEKILTPSLVAKLSVDSSDCEQECCHYKTAKQAATSARVVVMTHVGLLKRIHHRRTGVIDGWTDPLTGEVKILPVDTLIIDELHLFRDAISLALDENIPLIDEKHNVRDPVEYPKREQYKGYHTKIHTMCSEAREHWEIECAEVLRGLTGSTITLDESRRQFRAVHALANAPNNECDAIWRVWNLAKGMYHQRGVKDKLAFAKQNGICKCMGECDPDCKPLRNAYLYAARCNNSRETCRRAMHALMHQADKSMKVDWLEGCYLVPESKHDTYVDIVDDEKKRSKTGKKLVLKNSCPDEALRKLYARFQGVVGTSGTIGTPKHSRIPATIQHFVTPFDLAKQITVYRMENSLCWGVPRGKNRSLQHNKERAISVGNWLRKKSKEYFCTIVLTNKETASLLRDHFHEMTWEDDTDSATLAKQIGTRGGIGVWHNWHGTDVRTDKKKLLVLERKVIPKPGRGYAALELHTSENFMKDLVAAEVKSKCIQGIGRAIRGMNEQCDIILLDEALGNLQDPRQ